ncbi:MAG: flagellar biosynthesis protein FlhA [Tepidisphaeraceae bacterium]
MPQAPGTPSLTARLRANRGMIFPLACVGLVLVLLVPLPTPALDLLLILNLTLSVIILVTTIYVASPREFAVFPSLLLAITLFRLVLNVAATRLILSGDGTEASAGQVVQTFSHFVTSGSVAVGAILFLIIFVIQFVVITKGGSRISEVAARFVLDALPGKQMAIDADLNAGVITRQQAQERREAISREADFYSAMDGAGKFVRGDAIAAVVITIVNIVGGLYVGLFERGIALVDCLPLYTKLTIGDGLVSQIPAFIVSLAAGLIVTRSSSSSDLGEDLIGQVLGKPKALLVAAGFLAVLALTGMPKLPVIVLGGGCVALAYVLTPRKPLTVAAVLEEQQLDAPELPGVERLLDLDVLELEIGPGLVKLADRDRGGDLLERVAGVREQIALELGVIVPAVGIRDNARLGVNDYAIKLRGQCIARGIVYPDQFLAIDNGEATGAIAHTEETIESARHRLAYWITESQQDEAEQLGYVVVESPAVMVNYLTEVLRTHAHELLTRQAVKSLLDNLKTRAAAVVEEVVPSQIKPGELQRVLQNLLRERVPIRDLETILETVGDYATRTHDTELLAEYARVALGRTICRQYVDEHDRLPCLMLEAGLEELIAGHVEHSEGSINTMPPATAQRVGHEIAEAAAQHARGGVSPVVLCAPGVRSAVRKLIEPIAPHVAVLSLAEVVGDVTPEVLGVVGDAVGDAAGNQHVGDHGNDADQSVEDGYESTNV